MKTDALIIVDNIATATNPKRFSHRRYPALLAALTPSGAFSTTTAPGAFTFSLWNASSNDAGSGFPFPSNWSPLIIMLNASIPNISSMTVSTSSFAEPVTTAFEHPDLLINSLTPSKGRKYY